MPRNGLIPPHICHPLMPQLCKSIPPPQVCDSVISVFRLYVYSAKYVLFCCCTYRIVRHCTSSLLLLHVYHFTTGILPLSTDVYAFHYTFTPPPHGLSLAFSVLYKLILFHFIFRCVINSSKGLTTSMFRYSFLLGAMKNNSRN